MDKDTDFPFVSGADCAVSALELIESRYSKQADDSPGLEHWLLKGRAGRLKTGMVTLVAGGPGAGKTAFAVSLLRNLLCAGHTAAVFTPGAEPGDFMDRLIAAYSGASYRGLSTGTLHREDWPRITRAASTIAEASLWLCGRAGMTAEAIHADAAQLAGRLAAENKKLDLILIDPAGGAGFGAEDFGALAADTGAAVLYTLGVESGKKTLSLSDLRRCGVSERGLGLVLVLGPWRAGGASAELPVKILLGGNGRQGKLKGDTASCCIVPEPPTKPCRDFFRG